jgi:hypothetical protein
MSDFKRPKTITIPISYEMWETIRSIAFIKDTSINNLTREGLEIVIKKNEKILHNSKQAC